LKSAWLGAVHQSWTAGEKINLQALEKEYKLPIFAGLSVCLTGFEDSKLLVLIGLPLDSPDTVEFRSQLECYITEYGDDYQRKLTKNVTLLIAKSPKGRKYEHAQLWHVRVVSILWVSDCVKRGMVLEESLYDPARSLEEQIKAVLGQEAKANVQLGKRLRDGDPHQEPRKCRKQSSQLELGSAELSMSLTLSVGDEQRGGKACSPCGHY
jgi:DNA replication regulator DPB11